MGIEAPVEEYEKNTLNSLGLKYRGLKWCELGNQIIIHMGNKVAKEIYSSLGVEHISIDLNGENGALPIDLDKPVPFIFLNQFDVITNYGTLEHVNNQVQAFKNVHDMCKKDGIMIHVLPPPGNWPKHCRYYYSEKFMKKLARICEYQMINYKSLDKSEYAAPKNLIAVTYIKKKNNVFINKEDFDKIEGLTDTGDLKNTGNYTKNRLNIILNILKNLKAVFST